MKILKRCIVASLFIAIGVAAGSFVTHTILMKKFMVFQKGPTQKDMIFLVDRMDDKLDLSESQREEFIVILGGGMAAITELKKEHNPQVRQIILDTNARLRPLLNDEQKEIFDRFTKERVMKLPF